MPITIHQIGTGPDNNFISGAILDSTSGIWVLSGGTAIDTTVKAGGYLDINSGGTATNIKWTPCVGQVFARDGAYVTYASSYSGVYYGYNNQLVSSAATLVNKSVSGTSGAMYVMAGGVADNTSVSEDGFMYIHSGGTANRTTVSGYNAHIRVRSGGTATSTHIVSSGSMLVFSKGIAKDSVVDSWGRMTVASGGTASNTIVSSGSVEVSGGGILADTIIGHAGTVNLSSGGTAANTTLKGGKLILGNGARITDSLTFDLTSASSNNDVMLNNLSLIAGGVSLNITVSANQALGEYKIAEGASSFSRSITVNTTDGTTLGTVYAGDSFSYGEYTYTLTNNNSSLFFIVSDLDTPIVPIPAPAVKTYNETTIVSSANAMTGKILISGGQENIMHVSSGGMVVSTTVNSLGKVYVSSGGTADITTISGRGDLNGLGGLYVFNGGTANRTTLNHGGYLFVSGGGMANYTMVNSQGALTVSSGGTANYTTVNSRGSMFVLSGATANYTTIDSLGWLKVSSGGTALNVMWTPGVGSITVVDGAYVTYSSSYSGVYYRKSSAMAMEGKIVTEWEAMYIFNNGTVTRTTINDYGHLYIYSSGTVNSSMVYDYGTIHVSSGGMANSTTVNAGNLTVYSGGTANYTTVNSTIRNYGELSVSSGGTANCTTVNSNGRMRISSGGTANTTIVNSHGSMTIAGGTANTTIVNSHGSMTIASGKITGTLQLGTGAVVSAYSGSIVDFTVSGRTTEDGYLVNNLSLIKGTPTFTITVDDNQTTGTYKLAQGASAFTGTISIGTDGANYGRLTVNNGMLEYNSKYYDLLRQDGDLTLRIRSDITAPTIQVTASTTTITNQSVLLTATAEDNGGIASIEYSWDGCNWNVYNGEVSVDSNQTVYFRATDTSGNVSEITSYTVTNIDKIAPNKPTASANITKTTNQDVTVSAAFSNDSAQKQYSLNNANWQTYAGGVVMSTNGTVYFRGIDAAGNMSEVTSYAVTNIDKIAPTKPSTTVNTTAPTNQNVTVTATFSEDSAQKQYSLNNSTWQNYSTGVVMSANGMVYFRGIDAAGNMSEVTSCAVTNIDKVAPVKPTASADITKATNQNVTVSATFSNDTSTRQYRLDNSNWQAYTTGVVMSANGTVYFRGIDAAGNVSDVTSYAVSNIDKVAPVITLAGDNQSALHETLLTATVDDGSALFYRTGSSEWIEYTGPITVDANAVYNFKATDAAGNTGTASMQFNNILSVTPENLNGSSAGLAWNSAGVSGFVVEYSKDDFEHTLRMEVAATAVDTLNLPTGTYQWRVCSAKNGEWVEGNNFAANTAGTVPQLLQSDADGNPDVFFAQVSGTWNASYCAQHVGSLDDDWEGTMEKAALNGKNRIADIFEGSADANVLLLTDNSNGDALFIDDIYTALPGTVPQQQARISQIKEIRAGAGDDIIDLTSQQFHYTGDGMTVRGGLGNDTIWANKGSSKLFGDAGEDRLVGASGDDVLIGGSGNDSMHGGGGNDIFTFCENWGNDTVEQLAHGSVLLWFESGSLDNWNADSLTYADGENSVKVSGVTADQVTLKFGDDGSGQYAALAAQGAFAEAASEKIFEDKAKGLLA